MSPEYLAHLVSVYGYVVIFPFAIIEGPILIVIGGFLVSLKLLNPYILYAVVLLGDVVGDALCYMLGRFGHSLMRRWGHVIGLTENRLLEARRFFDTNYNRAVIASKLIHGIGWTGLVAAGSLHIPYVRFARTCAVISALQALVLLFVGIVFGQTYLLIGEYLSYFAAAGSVGALAAGFLYLVYRFKIRRT